MFPACFPCSLVLGGFGGGVAFLIIGAGSLLLIAPVCTLPAGSVEAKVVPERAEPGGEDCEGNGGETDKGWNSYTYLLLVRWVCSEGGFCR